MAKHYKRLRVLAKDISVNMPKVHHIGKRAGEPVGTRQVELAGGGSKTVPVYRYSCILGDCWRKNYHQLKTLYKQLGGDINEVEAFVEALKMEAAATQSLHTSVVERVQADEVSVLVLPEEPVSLEAQNQERTTV